MHDFLASIPSNAEGCAACAPLDDFLVISASGADALTFLHGQLTQDVTGLPADAARLAGYCTAGPAAGHAADVARRPGRRR